MKLSELQIYQIYPGLRVVDENKKVGIITDVFVKLDKNDYVIKICWDNGGKTEVSKCAANKIHQDNASYC